MTGDLLVVAIMTLAAASASGASLRWGRRGAVAAALSGPLLGALICVALWIWRARLLEARQEAYGVGWLIVIIAGLCFARIVAAAAGVFLLFLLRLSQRRL